MTGARALHRVGTAAGSGTDPASLPFAAPPPRLLAPRLALAPTPRPGGGGQAPAAAAGAAAAARARLYDEVQAQPDADL